MLFQRALTGQDTLLHRKVKHPLESFRYWAFEQSLCSSHDGPSASLWGDQPLPPAQLTSQLMSPWTLALVRGHPKSTRDGFAAAGRDMSTLKTKVSLCSRSRCPGLSSLAQRRSCRFGGVAYGHSIFQARGKVCACAGHLLATDKGPGPFVARLWACGLTKSTTLRRSSILPP